jgi:hypothetical protein
LHFFKCFYRLLKKSVNFALIEKYRHKFVVALDIDELFCIFVPDTAKGIISVLFAITVEGGPRK